MPRRLLTMRFHILAALILLLPAAARAGAWLQPTGGSYVKVAGVHSATTDRIDCRGDREPAEPFGGTYSENKIFLYGEYGWTGALTAVGSFGFGEQEIVDAEVPDYGTRSSGDLRVGLRWGLRRDPRLPRHPIHLEANFVLLLVAHGASPAAGCALASARAARSTRPDNTRARWRRYSALAC